MHRICHERWLPRPRWASFEAVTEKRVTRRRSPVRASFVRALWLAGASLVVAAASFACVVSSGSAQLFERRLVYPTHAVPQATAPDDFRWLEATAIDGVRVHALELAGPESAPVVVHFHNNRQRAEHGVELARALRDLGLGVVLVEYRGYGVSRPGSPSEGGLYRDATAVLDSLAGRGVTHDRVILWGHSLGTGVAAEMAARGRGRALVLVAPFTSIPALVADVVPFVPAASLVRNQFQTLTKCSAIAVPTLVIHGTEDEIVPLWMGETLARSVAGRARLLVVDGGHHSDLFARDGERLLSEVRRLAHE